MKNLLVAFPCGYLQPNKVNIYMSANMKMHLRTVQHLVVSIYIEHQGFTETSIKKLLNKCYTTSLDAFQF